ncbi:hypothetical protein BG011_009766 [Mortierella polycephala]|uniref:Uncharacterized protein n=1 Tax=Mortierella polycephala TaxID=41804 RepID=A0A9P6UB38_9FUNG|nr:hypothetical protein BG011_009766 [Mortierella polycephala]
MFGKTREHYAKHFLLSLRSLPFKMFDEFDRGFRGMICDFSDAERVGFELAIRGYYSIPDCQAIQLERHYRFCEVHFKRSLTRIRGNAAIVHHSKEAEFYETILGMLDRKHTKESFDELVSKIRQEDTNAQESLGADFQRLLSGKKLTLLEAIKHTTFYIRLVDGTCGLAATGMPTRYGKRKDANVNDGRAPDTTKALLGRKDSKNKAPRLGSTIDWRTFGTPWDIKYSDKNFTATNTCPLDTILMT